MGGGFGNGVRGEGVGGGGAACGEGLGAEGGGGVVAELDAGFVLGGVSWGFLRGGKGRKGVAYAVGG